MNDRSAKTRTVRVTLPGRAYEVVIGAGVLVDLGIRTRERCIQTSGRAFMAVDSGLPAHLVEQAARSLTGAGFRTSSHVLNAREEEKTFHPLFGLVTAIAETRHERGDPLVALGGGIVGDVGGFAAATYRRGVPVIQCPTTLLAMVDASVGGKTGINLAAAGGLRKNLVGSFHQPALVLADTTALDSLAQRHFRSGLAECTKHAMLAADWGDADLMSWMSSNLDRILGRDPGVLVELIARNVAVKAAVVGGDEREEAIGDSGRAVLNLGHTFAHALETLPGIAPSTSSASPLHHGEAVGLGLLAACRTAAAVGACGPEREAEARSMLARIGLPSSVMGLPPDEAILAAMAHDKKAVGDSRRLVLPAGPGRVRVVSDVGEGAVRTGLSAIRA